MSCLGSAVGGTVWYQVTLLQWFRRGCWTVHRALSRPLRCMSRGMVAAAVDDSTSQRRTYCQVTRMSQVLRTTPRRRGMPRTGHRGVWRNLRTMNEHRTSILITIPPKLSFRATWRRQSHSTRITPRATRYRNTDHHQFRDLRLETLLTTRMSRDRSTVVRPDFDSVPATRRRITSEIAPLSTGWLACSRTWQSSELAFKPCVTSCVVTFVVLSYKNLESALRAETSALAARTIAVLFCFLSIYSVRCTGKDTDYSWIHVVIILKL